MVLDVRRERTGSVSRWLLWLAVVALLFGTKAIVIAHLGVSVPWTDQWDTEAAGLYPSYLAGTLSWAQLLAGDNEHRILFARLLLLALFEFAGQWDPILDMLVNAVIHSLFGVAFAALLAAAAPRSWGAFIIAFTCFCLVLPVGIESRLIGLNSSFYLLLLFSLVAIWTTLTRPGLTPLWGLGLIFAAASDLTLASGLLTAWTIAAVQVIQLLLRTRERNWREIAALVAVMALGCVEVLTMVVVPGNARLHARSVWQFLTDVVTLGSLPLATVAGFIVVQAPIAAFVITRLRRPEPLSAKSWAVMGLALWVAAQICAAAYSRAQGLLASRYLDIVILLVPLNALALCMLVKSSGGLAFRWMTGFAAVWLFLVVAALGVETDRFALPVGNGISRQLSAAVPRIIAFERTGNDWPLQSVSGAIYPDGVRLEYLLSSPRVQAVLPANIRPASADLGAMQAKLRLRGRLAEVAQSIKAILLDGPSWIAAGFALAFIAAWLARTDDIEGRRRQLPGSPTASGTDS